MEWGRRSQAAIDTCDPRLQLVLELVKQRMTERDMDCSVTCGYRNEEDQAQAVRDGASFADFPNSHHNVLPSPAVDCIPFPTNWDEPLEFYRLAAIVLSCSLELDIPIRWGGMFKRRNGKLFFDGPHYQLMDPLDDSD